MNTATKILKKMTQPDKSAFGALVDEALALYREINDVANQFGDARDEKLSAKGYLREALANANLTIKEVEEIDRALYRLPAKSHSHLFKFIGNVYAGAVATRFDKAVNLRPVVGNLHWFVQGDSNAFTSVIVEGMSVGAKPVGLVAAAVLRATKEAPETFGNIDDWDEHEAATAAKQARLEALYARIAQEWRTADLEFGGDGSTIALKYEEVVVSVAPPASLGARLCEALAAT
jgi:hypothetical protein